MVLSTSQLRRVYAPHCRAVHNFREAYIALDACFRKWNYAPEKGHTGAQNCRPITGSSTAWSLHAFFGKGVYTFWSGVRTAMALAVDINWRYNPYGPRLVTNMPRGMIDDILAIRTNSGARVWGWGGYYRGNKDAMHFEIVCHPNDLITGIDLTTLPGGEDMAQEDIDWMKNKLNQIHTESKKREERTINLIHGLEKRLEDLEKDQMPLNTLKQWFQTVKAIAKEAGVEIPPYPSD